MRLKDVMVFEHDAVKKMEGCIFLARLKGNKTWIEPIQIRGHKIWTTCPALLIENKWEYIGPIEIE